jgi:hypothetical protein
LGGEQKRRRWGGKYYVITGRRCERREETAEKKTLSMGDGRDGNGRRRRGAA